MAIKKHQQIAHNDNVNQDDVQYMFTEFVLLWKKMKLFLLFLQEAITWKGGKWKWHIEMNEGMRLIKVSLKGMDG